MLLLMHGFWKIFSRASHDLVLPIFRILEQMQLQIMHLLRNSGFQN